jgi:UDPglucose 6-dehydrogenase
LIRIIEDINEAQDEFLFNRVRQCCLLSESTGVSVLGLAFKPGTPVITASPSIRLIERLLAEGIRVFAYDPLAMDNAKALLGDRIQYASSVKACMSREAVCVVATAAAEFAAIDRSYIGQNPTTLIDCWRILEPSKLGDQVHYVALSKRPAGRATRTTIDEQRNVQHKPRPSEERLRA